MAHLEPIQYVPAITFRREPRIRYAGYPIDSSVSTPAPAWVAPMPPPVTLDGNEGRDSMHGPTPIVTVNNFAIGEWTSIATRFLGGPGYGPKLFVNMPRGHMNPLRERVNIERPPIQPLGDKVSINQQNLGSSSLGKLRFRL